MYRLLLAVRAFNQMSIAIKIDEVAFRHDLLQLQCGATVPMGITLRLRSGYPGGGNVSVR
jgi:hypothetical protein